MCLFDMKENGTQGIFGQTILQILYSGGLLYRTFVPSVRSDGCFHREHYRGRYQENIFIAGRHQHDLR